MRLDQYPAKDIPDEQVDALEDLSILCLPPEVVLPGIDVPHQAHRGAVSVEIGEAVLCAFACFETLHGIEETSGVGGGAHEVGGLPQ